MPEGLVAVATLVAIVGQAIAVAYWGGRLAATLDGLAGRVGRLEDLTHAHHPPGG